MREGKSPSRESDRLNEAEQTHNSNREHSRSSLSRPIKSTASSQLFIITDSGASQVANRKTTRQPTPTQHPLRWHRLILAIQTQVISVVHNNNSRRDKRTNQGLPPQPSCQLSTGLGYNQPKWNIY